MKSPTEKDLYSILGIHTDASSAEIRRAYLARIRVVHPDRFDKQNQTQDWMKANEMLAELNEAYAVLHDPDTREEYDRLRSEEHRSPPPQSAAPIPPTRPPTVGPQGLTGGQVHYGELPKKARDRLRKRQENKGEDQFQLRMDSIGWNYGFIAILLCWFGYLFASSAGAKWKDETLYWYVGITLAVGLLIGCSATGIMRWSASTLKSFFYITPLYYIKTEYDVLWFRPIWALKDLSVTHNYRNGSYQDSTVLLTFEGRQEALTLPSQEQVKVLFKTIGTFEGRLRDSVAGGDHQYIQKHDDFSGVVRPLVPQDARLPLGRRVLAYASSLLLCGIALTVAAAMNEDYARKKWVQQPLLVSDSSERKAEATRGWGAQDPVIETVPLPSSGSVKSFTSAERVAPLEIKASTGSHYLVKLVDAYTYACIVTVFVRSGSTVSVDVPLGTYEVRYASGSEWYGYRYLFGPDTAYSKADRTFTFEVSEGRVSGYTITLYKVPRGNLQTSKIKATDF